MDHIVIYTDGGADPNPGPGGWGAVLLHPPTGKSREISGGEPRTTNNRMELTAAIRALENLHRPCRVDLYTDSQYLRRGITEWLQAWKKQGWRRKTGEPVLNAELWRQLAEQADRHRVSWHWLKGHAGNRHNERADELASAAIRREVPEVSSSGGEVPGEITVFLKVSGSEQGAWAALVRGPDGEQVLVGRRPGATSNQLDLIAATEALEKLPEGARATVYSASDYLRNGAEMWLGGWRKRGWKTAAGQPVKNAREWKRLSTLLDSLRVSWPPVAEKSAPEWKLLRQKLRS